MSARLGGALVCMTALLAAGLSTGTRVYYLLFFLLLAIVLLGLVSSLATLWTLKIGMRGARPRATRGDRLMCVFSVRHASLLPPAFIGIRISVPSSPGAEQELYVRTPPFREKSFRHVITCPHRGIYEAGVSRVWARDLFGMFQFSRKNLSRSIAIEVMPRLRRADAMTLDAIDLGPESMARFSEDAASPSDIRAWQDGDSLKKVHWKLSMRRREVMVRTYEESARPDTLVLPDLSPLTALRDQQLSIEDEICERCLAAAKAQLDAGDPVCMPLTGAQPSELTAKQPGEIGAFADALMRVAFDSPYPYEQVLMLMMNRLQRTGGAVLVTARLTMRVADIAVKMQQSGIQVRLVWVSDDPRDEVLMLLERVRMEGVQVERADLRSDGAEARDPNEKDDYDAEA